ncbi:hypothetical protein B1H38_12470 [Leptospira borgpetersenii serovar Ballum]|nr:hypothetical protein [Leptospira borgpetersenii]OOV43269.1 hypothetical protein B1H38_12470 [Leptospira borgpetersenii serovar Ballum]
MLFSNELNYWVIKKNAKKYLLLRMGAPYQNLSQNLRYRNSLISSFKNILETLNVSSTKNLHET